MTPAIAFRNVSWGMPGAGGLDRIGLSVPEGQFLAVCGPAGAGKAALLRLMAREAPPGAGAVCLFSRDIWLMSAEEAARLVLLLSPAGNAFADMTPRQVVETAWRAGSSVLSPVERRAREEEVLRHAGLAASAEEVLGRLPPGWRMRALIARAVLLRPRVVLLAGAGDEAELRFQTGLLSGLRREGVTLVAALEDARLAMDLADRVVELDRGRVVADTPARVAAAQP